jgi:hypothetical protein
MTTACRYFSNLQSVLNIIKLSNCGEVDILMFQFWKY